MPSEKTLINRIRRYASDGLNGQEAARLSRFAREYFAPIMVEDFADRDPRTLGAAARSHYELAESWTRGHRRIRIDNPPREPGSQGPLRTVIQLVTKNMPFLVDSITMELTRLGLTPHLIMHPMICVVRDKRCKIRKIESLADKPDENSLESFIHVEVDRETDKKRLRAVAANLNRVLENVRLAVSDQKAMTETVQAVVEELNAITSPVERAERRRCRSFLNWLLDNNFTFLGYQRTGAENGDAGQRSSKRLRSELGVLRGQKTSSPPDARAFESSRIGGKVPGARLLRITKSAERSTVHRPAHLDCIIVNRVNGAGRSIGEHRILGLFTWSAYMGDPRLIPIVRQKIDRLMRWSRLIPSSHASKALLGIINHYPRDELFQADVDELYRAVMGVYRLRGRQRVRLFVRRDPFDRFFACTVYVPKDHFSSSVHRRIKALLQEAFNGIDTDFRTLISEAPYAQLYLVINTSPGGTPAHDIDKLEAAVAATTLTWQDELSAALIKVYGEDQENIYSRLYGNAFPASYIEDHSAIEAAHDISDIEHTIANQRPHLNLYRDAGMADDQLMFKLMNPDSAIALSNVIPIFENMGLFIDSERPYKVHRDDSKSTWLHDFGMRYRRKGITNLARIREPFQQAFDQIWQGQIENDGFNELVLCAELRVREIILLRAYARYLRQIGTTFSQEYIAHVLINNPKTTRLLVNLFSLRFDPGLSDAQRRRIVRLKQKIGAHLDAVVSLDEDKILRRIYALIIATLRTNYFQHKEDGSPKGHLSLKFAPELIPGLPSPCPRFEIFVYSPRVEGVHLRGGKVARGGIRWSDRREDFRTEVLGLMKAQMVKNAVIVPVGAKGGFYVKQAPAADAGLIRQEGIECYKTFIRGLLDLTDNQIGDRVVPPANVVRYDDDDPYLVVAADKGTASFSDIANGVAAEYGFWLGDAFASGGSAGYDHKKIGITARGAWESVKHHFQLMGGATREQTFTVIGIGDMSGDVFGNGMLLSRRIKLVGAFNHVHIFLDPDPDPETSFSERQRLFDLPGSSWADYDKRLISAGGGVYSRTVKTIVLSPEVKTLVRVEEDSMSPDELIRVLLMAPVDLLWNGGIGTYVKSDDEQQIKVGDKPNDNVRINSSRLACRVIGEGGNLGITQRGRIAFAKRGGWINTDWIDNSGGVSCSDREVNIKILLNARVADGSLTLKERNRLLNKMTGNVASLVLQDNYRQVRAISIAEIESKIRLGWYEVLITKLETHEGFSRTNDWLPDQAALDKRKATGSGLWRPEIAALLAHTKTALYTEILASTLPDDPYLTSMLMRYFPKPLRENYASSIDRHPLRREIIATVATNSMVNRAGMTFAYRLADETGRSVADIAKAYLLARDIFSINDLWAEIDKLDYKVSVETQALLVFEIQYLLRHAARWFLVHRQSLENTAVTVAEIVPCVVALRENIRRLLSKPERDRVNSAIREYRLAGVPRRVASLFASLRIILMAPDISSLALPRNLPFEPVTLLFFYLGANLRLFQIRAQAEKLVTKTLWQDLARVEFIQELNRLQASLTGEALGFFKPGDDPAVVVEAWARNNVASLGEYRAALEKMRFTGAVELAMFPIILQKLRNFQR